MKNEILVVDDDRKTVDLIKMYLEHEGYRVRAAYDGAHALEVAREVEPGLVVLDLMLPRVDGLDVCRALRQSSAPLNATPIIMLTARSTEEDTLRGLELGADDYVTKPFSPRELVARVRAVLRRATTPYDADGEPDEPPARFGDLVVDFVRHEVRVRDQVVSLTPKEFKILRVLVRAPGRAFTRFALLERAFGGDYEGLERTVDVHVSSLRRKIEPDPAHPIYVVTVFGVGYRFAGEPEGA